MANVKLTRKGFLGTKDVRKKNREWTTVTRRIPLTFDLLKYWDGVLEIDPDVKTGDLFKLMKKMDPGLLTVIEMLTDSTWHRHLATALPAVEDEDKHPLKWVEVYRNVDIDDYDKKETFTSYTSAHGVGKIWEDVNVMSGVSKEDAKDCNVYAIEFVPWNKLANVLLRIRPTVYFNETRWKDVTPRKLSIKSTSGKSVFNFTRKRDLDKKRCRRLSPRDTDMKLGEFFCGLANELCFFSGPASQDKQKAILDERIEDVEKDIKKKKK